MVSLTAHLTFNSIRCTIYVIWLLISLYALCASSSPTFYLSFFNPQLYLCLVLFSVHSTWPPKVKFFHFYSPPLSPFLLFWPFFFGLVLYYFVDSNCTDNAAMLIHCFLVCIAVASFSLFPLFLLSPFICLSEKDLPFIWNRPPLFCSLKYK